MDPSFDVTREDIPSRMLPLLREMKGRVLVDLDSFLWFSPEENFASWGTPQEMLFSLGGGPLLMTLDSGLVVTVGGEPSLVSLVLSVERDDRCGYRASPSAFDDLRHYTPINVSNLLYSNTAMRQFLGKRITSIRLLKRGFRRFRDEHPEIWLELQACWAEIEPDKDAEDDDDSDKDAEEDDPFLGRPCESGLILGFGDGSELLLSHGLHDESDSFSVITPEQIDVGLVDRLRETPLDI